VGLELIRDTLRFEQVVGEGQSQALVNRDIIVPDIKPDIARILSVEGKVNITSREVNEGRIAVEGDVNLQILYAPSEGPQPIYSMSQNANFSHYVDVVGAAPKMDSEVRCDIEHIDFDRINGRKLNIQCVLNLKGKVTDYVSVDAIKEVEGMPGIQILRDTVLTDEAMGDNTAQTVVRGTVTIPESLPQADELLKYSAMIHNRDVKVEDGKVIISGNVFIPLLYSSKDENVDIYKVDDDMVFTHTMDMPGITPDMTCRVEHSVEDIYAELKEDEESQMRLIEIEVVLGLKAKVTQRVEFPVMIDAYAPSARIECEKKSIMMDVFFGGDSSQTIVKESLELPEDLKDMEKVYDMICKPSVTDCKAVEDKVLIEGVVGCDILYLAKGEERSQESFYDELPFRTSIDLPGCKTGMKPEVNVEIENMVCTMLTKSLVEIKIILNCPVKVYDKVGKDFIIKIDEIEGETPIPKASITIYMVQPKDTMWKIAKRYFTTVDDIVKVNEIADPDKITPGMKLIIPKKVQ